MEILESLRSQNFALTFDLTVTDRNAVDTPDNIHTIVIFHTLGQELWM